MIYKHSLLIKAQSILYIIWFEFGTYKTLKILFLRKISIKKI